MGEAIINQGSEDAVLKALPPLFSSLLGAGYTSRTEFYNKFQRVADDNDKNFIQKHNEELNSTLIFAGLFSAVTSTFIVDIQSELGPDFEEMNHSLLKIIASAALGNIPTGADAAFPQWNGPDPTIIRVQAILYSSLFASLLAALFAMLGKQWLNRYAWVDFGSVVDRSRLRKHKMDGMETWNFGLVMGCLPLILQAALFLLSYALSECLYFVNKVVASVIAAFLAFTIIFYILIVSVATFSYNCPFQTPLSVVLRTLIRLDRQKNKYLERSVKWLGRLLSQMKKGWLRAVSVLLSGSSGSGAPDWDTVGGIELLMTTPFGQPPPLFNYEIDRDGFAVDSSCIVWMFKKPMDTDVAVAVTRFIPEIVWHPGINVTPLKKLYDTVLGSFDLRSTGRLILKPVLRDSVYLSAKAFLHIYIQRKCLGNGSEEAVFESILSRHQPMAKHYKGDPDLESILGVIDCAIGDFFLDFGDSSSMRWQHFSFTIPHHTWMSHILLYWAFDVYRKHKILPGVIKGFVLHSVRSVPLPPAPIIADCLFIVGLGLGIQLHCNDLAVLDKSHGINIQINRIYERLPQILRASTTKEIDQALLAMEVITSISEEISSPISGSPLPQRCYDLFRSIRQVPISLAFSRKKMWEASRLAMHGAYKRDKFLPLVGDPQDLLDFLKLHFDLATQHGQNQDEPIQDALRALAYASGPDTINALKSFDPTETSFVHGVCYAYHDGRPAQLHKAALFLLPLIGDGWFNTPHPIMGTDQMRRFCADWVSVVDDVEHTRDAHQAILATLFYMINSPHWRPHIVTDSWKLLEYLTSVPDDSQPLRRCLDNPALTTAISEVEDPAAVFLWSKILWLKYAELAPEVREQLETVTRELAQSGRGTDLDKYLEAMDFELRKAEGVLNQYHTQPTEPAVNALKAKIENLQQARRSLTALKEDTP